MANLSEHELQKMFEQDVREIASSLWPSAIGGGAEIADGKERDGIYHTEDTIHLIESTVSRSKDKAVQDGKKLHSLVMKMQGSFPEKAIKGWFITKDEPTAEQRTAINKYNSSIVALSFNRFQSKLIEVWEYFNCREKYPFGSVRDPNTGNFSFQDEYIKIALRDEQNEQYLDIKNITDSLIEGNRLLVLGHYGVGKSMALARIYSQLVSIYQNKQSLRFPIYINLRDHQGQTDAVEALHRHAKNIGFNHPDHLVRAWRAGYIILILDGFDEMAALGWAGKASKLRDIRYKTMELLRKFIKEQPLKSGLIISGRLNYFDSTKECISALSITGNHKILKIGDFSQSQIEEYLSRKGLSPNLPEWIPTRPLLLSYLAAKGILSQAIDESGVTDIAEGWNYLLDKISEREAGIEAGLEPAIIREIIEALSSIARKNQSGLGPINQEDLEKVFMHKCGYSPDDRALVLLQRLPGLTPQDQQDGTRQFIDSNFAEAAKAGDVYRYILNPFDYRMVANPRKWVTALSDTGIKVLSYLLIDKKDGVLESAIIKAIDDDFVILAADILLAMNNMNCSWSRENVEFKDVFIPNFEIKRELDWSRIIFNQCFFQEMLIEEKPQIDKAPKFQYCLIGTVIGCSDLNGANDDIFKTCEVDSYESQSLATSSLLSIDQPIPVIVCLTILKKLYLQAGGGRQENAFYRGLSQKEQRYVPEVLNLLKQENIVLPPKKSSPNSVWQPIRAQKERIRQIVLNRSFNDELINKVKKLI